VEDNSTDLFVIRQVLLGCGSNFHVEVARNGQDALSHLEDLARPGPASAPALVLLDLNVPKITGIELLQFIRANAYFGELPVIIVTSSNAESDRTAAERLGANGYFHKPADLDAYQELAGLVKNVIERTSRR
jgi:two-component system, chemotaxis family, response regulator Rcp1